MCGVQTISEAICKGKLNVSKPSEHPPKSKGGMSKRLGGKWDRWLQGQKHLMNGISRVPQWR